MVKSEAGTIDDGDGHKEEIDGQGGHGVDAGSMQQDNEGTTLDFDPSVSGQMLQTSLFTVLTFKNLPADTVSPFKPSAIMKIYLATKDQVECGDDGSDGDGNETYSNKVEFPTSQSNGFVVNDSIEAEPQMYSPSEGGNMFGVTVVDLDESTSEGGDAASRLLRSIIGEMGFKAENNGYQDIASHAPTEEEVPLEERLNNAEAIEARIVAIKQALSEHIDAAIDDMQQTFDQQYAAFGAMKAEERRSNGQLRRARRHTMSRARNCSSRVEERQTGAEGLEDENEMEGFAEREGDENKYGDGAPTVTTRPRSSPISRNGVTGRVHAAAFAPSNASRYSATAVAGDQSVDDCTDIAVVEKDGVLWALNGRSPNQGRRSPDLETSRETSSGKISDDFAAKSGGIRVGRVNMLGDYPCDKALVEITELREKSRKERGDGRNRGKPVSRMPSAQVDGQDSRDVPVVAVGGVRIATVLSASPRDRHPFSLPPHLSVARSTSAGPAIPPAQVQGGRILYQPLNDEENLYKRGVVRPPSSSASRSSVPRHRSQQSRPSTPSSAPTPTPTPTPPNNATTGNLNVDVDASVSPRSDSKYPNPTPHPHVRDRSDRSRDREVSQEQEKNPVTVHSMVREGLKAVEEVYGTPSRPSSAYARGKPFAGNDVDVPQTPSRPPSAPRAARPSPRVVIASRASCEPFSETDGSIRKGAHSSSHANDHDRIQTASPTKFISIDLGVRAVLGKPQQTESSAPCSAISCEAVGPRDHHHPQPHAHQAPRGSPKDPAVRKGLTRKGDVDVGTSQNFSRPKSPLSVEERFNMYTSIHPCFGKVKTVLPVGLMLTATGQEAATIHANDKQTKKDATVNVQPTKTIISLKTHSNDQKGSLATEQNAQSNNHYPHPTPNISTKELDVSTSKWVDIMLKNKIGHSTFYPDINMASGAVKSAVVG